MTRHEAYAYYRACGLAYKDFDEEAVNFLIATMDKNFANLRQERLAKGEDYFWVHTIATERGVHMKLDEAGNIIYLKLFGRNKAKRVVEVIAFYENGVIRFGQGLEEEQIQPILQAFVEVCDWMQQR